MSRHMKRSGGPRREWPRARWCAVVVTLLASAGAHAGDCTINAVPVSFGSYDPIQRSTPAVATGSVQVSCRPTSDAEQALGVQVMIALGPGSSGSFGARTLRQGGDSVLRYNLYTTASGGHIWGDGHRGTHTVGGAVGGSSTGQPQNRSFPVYGRIPLGQDPAVGVHSDQVIVTVTF